MIKPLSFTLYLFIVVSFSLHAKGEPLRVAIDSFTPPFITESANNHFYGFDVSMMEYICQALERSCQFVPMPFKTLLSEVQANKVDVAVSGITITAARAEKVNFSLPYLLSQARFIGPQTLAKKPFNLTELDNRNIGIEEGTIFADALRALGVNTTKIISFDQTTSMMEALHQGEIDLALTDAPAALYWQSQSSGAFTMLGEPFSYGFGLGIAVNRNNTALLTQINQALLQYQNTADFKREYDKYIASF